MPLAFAILAWPAEARAQQAAADALFDSARASMVKGDLGAACEQFRASDKLDPAVGTELNLADCEEKRGRLASAWELYRTVADKLANNDERLAFARSRAQALKSRVPTLTLTLEAHAPRTSSFQIDGVEFGSAAFGVALPVDPGAHEILVSAPGLSPTKMQVRVDAGQSEARTVSPGAGAPTLSAGPHLTAPQFSAAPQFSTAPRESIAAPRAAASTRNVAFALGGVGLAGLGVGAVAGILELAKQHAVDDGCHPDKSCSSAGLSAAKSGRTLEIASNVGWVVGAVALGAGAYFLLTSGSSTKPSTSLAFTSGATAGRVSLCRSW